MEALINKVMEKTGLSADQAKGAVESVMEFVKGKLPEGLANKVDSMFGGAEGEKIEFGGMLDSIMGMLGGAKDKAGDAAHMASDAFEGAKDKAEDLLEGAGDKLEDLGEAAEDLAKDAFNKIKGMFGGDKK